MDKKDFESLLNKYPDCVSDGKKLSAFLKDLYPDVPKAILNTLTIMADDGIISEIKMSPESSSLVSARLQKKLEDDYGLSQNIISKCFSLISDNAKQTESTISAYTHEKITGFIDNQPKIALRKEGSQKHDIVQPEYNPKDFEIVKGVLKKYNGRSSVVVIPDSVTSIGDDAFENCPGLTSVTIPDSVTSIGDCSFFYCTGLTSITIPDSVTSIGEDAFDGCAGLTSVTIPDNVTSIGDYAFVGCSGLTKITGPSTVASTVAKQCGSKSFEVVITSGTSIGERAFRAFDSYPGLTSITIPDSVTSIGDSAFEFCANLQDIYITDIVAWCNISGLNYLMGEGASNKKLHINNELATSITIPNGVTAIPSFAFHNCTGLTSVTIGGSVTSIGDCAFSGCTGLTSVTIPDSVTSIGWGAFYDCTGLTSVTIPDSVESIGRWAFGGCRNLTIYCEAESKSIGWSSDWNSGDRPVVWGFKN